MKEDNTPTVSARRREKSARQHLRAQNAKKIPDVAARVAKKKESENRREEAKAEHEARKANEKVKGKNKTTKFAQPEAGEGKNKTTDSAQLEGGEGSTDKLAIPKPSVAKHKKRQLNKSWLPTHIFHTKRAQMTPPMEPLWRFSIPLTPTQKNYRVAHRASTLRGCIAWDASYTSTIAIEGDQGSLLRTLQALGIEDLWLHGKKGMAWRAGKRSHCTWIRLEEVEYAWIGKVVIIWEPQVEANDSRRLLVRVQPAAFLQLWEQLLETGKKQDPPVMLDDLRFEIGSIDITGPGSMEALVGILRQAEAPNDRNDPVKGATADTWLKMASVTDSFALPSGAMLSFSAADPRLGAPHRTLEKPQLSMTEDVLRLTSEWPSEETCKSSLIFDRQARLTACRQLPSQKSVNKRKGKASPGQHPAPLPADPHIPLLLLANNHDKKNTAQGSWTLLLPWKCVLAVWYCLALYPLSAGGNPRFGGLNEQRQICFENNKPWFPGDFPGTKSGWLWEIQEREKRKKKWDRKPKGRRIEFDSLDLGNGRKGEVGKGWACDWERLFDPRGAHKSSAPEQPPEEDPPAQDSNSEAPHDTSPSRAPPLDICHLPNPSQSLPSTPQHALATVSVTLLSRGVPTPCARIYRLPTNNPTLRSAWLALSKPTPTSKQSAKKLPRTPQKIQVPHATSPTSIAANRPLLAQAVLNWNKNKNKNMDSSWDLPNSADPVQAGDSLYPVVPDEEDLIGFVTAGNFNLGEGRGTGVGCVAWRKVLESGDVSRKREKGVGGEMEMGGLCVVREAGSEIGRVGRWRVVY